MNGLTDEQPTVRQKYLAAVMDCRPVPRSGHVEVKNSDGTVNYSYRHPTLNDVTDTVQEACTKHGLVVTQPIRTEIVEQRAYVFVDTTVSDTATGESIVFSAGQLMKDNPQANGSTITYFRRYALVAAFALEVDDDDDDGRAGGADPNRRTEAETEVWRLIEAMTKAERVAFKGDLVFEFGVGLPDIPTERHGDVLAWAKKWEYRPTEGARL